MADDKDDRAWNGGVRISGESRVQAHNIAGRDILNTAHISTVSHVFQPVTDAIQHSLGTNRSDALQQLEQLKQEVVKGDRADHHLMTKLIDGIVGLAPDALKALAKAFASPILAHVSGPATQHLFNKVIGG